MDDARRPLAFNALLLLLRVVCRCRRGDKVEANELLYGYAHRRLYVRVISGQSAISASHTYSITRQLYDKGAQLTLL